MNTSLTLHRTSLHVPHLILILVIVFAIGLPQAAVQPKSGQGSLPLAASSALLFQSESHLLRFEATRASMVGLDHNLEIEFLGTVGAEPKSTIAGNGIKVQSLEQVTYEGLWPGITMVFGVDAGAVAKSEYRVAPGGRPEVIRLRYSVAPVLQDDGSLVFAYPDAQGEIVESAPVAWQVINNKQVPVRAAFNLGEGGEIGFSIGRYDPQHELIIDPAYRWHTFFGGRSVVDLVGMCNAGLIYAVGTVNGHIARGLSTDLSMSYHGGKDIGVFKLDAAGRWWSAAYFGSDGDEEAKSVACDSESFYIVGTSAKTWLGYSDAAPLHAHSGGGDISVIKLSADTTITHNLIYNWHTFFGSANSDAGRDIALNGTDLLIAGSSYETWQGTGNISPKHAHQGESDFVTLKLSTSGAYGWHTFFGGVQSVDNAVGIASSGTAVWVVGGSDGTWKGGASTTTNPLHAHSGANDLTVLKLETDGDYLWHTFYGSSSSETGTAVSLHASDGTGYIVGYGSASWLGDGSGTNTPKHGHSGGSDITALSLNSSGAYQWHTFYGSSGADEGRDIVRDNNNKLLIVGYSAATWNAPTLPAVPFAGNGDAVFLKLGLDGSYERHDFYGGLGLDGFQAINLNGNLGLLSGFSEATWNGPAGEIPIEEHSKSHDGLRLWQASGNGYSSHGFLNSTMDDTLQALTVDSSGNIIVVGDAAMSWRGPGNEAPLKSYNGGSADLVVLKLNSSGSYLWHTIYGGKNWDTPSGVVCDSAGNIYLSGTSNETWNGPTGQAPVRTYSDGDDWYVLKLSPAGAYQWHTFLGGASLDQSTDIAYSATATSLYVVGRSLSNWSGLTPKNTHSGGYDITVASLHPTSGAVQWHTFFGTASADGASGVAAFGSSIYLTGYSPNSWNGPAGQLPLHATDGGTEFNAFVLKLTSAGNYLWHTYYGNRSAGDDIAMDPSENIYLLSGNRYSWNGPAGQLPTHPHAEYAPFVLKLSSGGTYQWHGFFGGNNACMAKRIAYSVTSEQLTIICEATIPWEAYGVIDPIRPYSGMRDGLMIRITKNGYYKVHTYLGSAENDYFLGLATQQTNEQIIVGGNGSLSWSYKGAEPAHSYVGGMDMFIAAFAPFTTSLFLPVTLK